jgi:hypothetical protein
VFFLYSEENSKTELINQDNTNIEQQYKSELFKNLVNLTPRNIAVMELITSEQRFVHDMKNILKVRSHFMFTLLLSLLKKIHKYLLIKHFQQKLSKLALEFRTN